MVITATALNSTSGNAFASYMLGAVNSSSVSVGLPGLGSRWLDPSFWAQDDYKISPKVDRQSRRALGYLAGDQ